jgi:hypothetical protein
MTTSKIKIANTIRPCTKNEDKRVPFNRQTLQYQEEEAIAAQQ